MSKGRNVPAQRPREQREQAQTRREMHPAIPERARELAADTLAEGKTLPHVITLVEDAVQFAGLLTREHASGEQAACRAGCAWCCSTTYVSTSAPEVIRIAEHLRATRSPEELAALVERLARREERIGAMNEERRRYARIPCALLVNNRCSVYDVRPLACRGIISSDAAACEASYRSGWVRQIPNGPRHLGISVGVRMGMRKALDDAGLDGAQLDLNAALRIALTTPDVAERWLSGEPIFAPAHLDP